MALIFNGFLKSGFKTGRCQSGFQAIGLNTKPETSEIFWKSDIFQCSNSLTIWIPVLVMRLVNI